MILQTTLSLAAAAAVINLWLGFRIGRLRHAAGIIHGDGGDPLLQRRVRAQLNFVENTPFLLILTGAVEMTGKFQPWLAVIGSVYMLARLCHAFGMDRESVNLFRGIGFAVSALCILGLAAVAVLIALAIL